MHYDEFIRRVQARGHFTSDEQTVACTNAVLGTLGECLYRSERDKLAAELPKELKHTLYAQRDPENRRMEVKQFRLEEFFNRVRARADVGARETETCALAVIRVLHEAVSEGTMADVKQALPEEYSVLLRAST